MTRVRVPLIASLLITIIAACSRHDPVAADTKAVNFPVSARIPEHDPLGGPPENATAEVSATSATSGTAGAFAIPSPLQGRWGLSPSDCTAAQRSNAKGLLIVSAKGLGFYESDARPTADVQTDDGSINGRFDFTGQGHSWSKFEALRKSGDKLIRTEDNPAASYTYAKC